VDTSLSAATSFNASTQGLPQHGAEPEDEQQDDERRALLEVDVKNLNDKVAQLEAERELLRDKIHKLQHENADLQCGPTVCPRLASIHITSQCSWTNLPVIFVASCFG
jgi:uncharacterized protein YlxW (UPF0749 family)